MVETPAAHHSLDLNMYFVHMKERLSTLRLAGCVGVWLQDVESSYVPNEREFGFLRIKEIHGITLSSKCLKRVGRLIQQSGCHNHL